MGCDVTADRFACRSDSPEQTIELGRRLGLALAPGDVVALIGDLGAGKTVFVRGIANGLGIAPDAVRSPTFTLLDRHDEGRIPLVHADVYRLANERAFRDLDIGLVTPDDAAAVIEWADRVLAALPEDRLTVRIEHEGESTRRIAATGGGARSLALLRTIEGGARC